MPLQAFYFCEKQEKITQPGPFNRGEKVGGIVMAKTKSSVTTVPPPQIPWFKVVRGFSTCEFGCPT